MSAFYGLRCFCGSPLLLRGGTRSGIFGRAWALACSTTDRAAKWCQSMDDSLAASEDIHRGVWHYRQVHDANTSGRVAMLRAIEVTDTPGLPSPAWDEAARYLVLRGLLEWYTTDRVAWDYCVSRLAGETPTAHMLVDYVLTRYARAHTWQFWLDRLAPVPTSRISICGGRHLNGTGSGILELELTGLATAWIWTARTPTTPMEPRGFCVQTLECEQRATRLDGWNYGQLNPAHPVVDMLVRELATIGGRTAHPWMDWRPNRVYKAHTAILHPSGAHWRDTKRTYALVPMDGASPLDARFAGEVQIGPSHPQGIQSGRYIHRVSEFICGQGATLRTGHYRQVHG